MSYFSGKTGRIKFGATSQPLSNWSIQLKADVFDVTNFLSSGWAENLGGVTQADITADGPYQEALGVTVGSTVVLTLDVDSNTGVQFTGTATVESVGASTGIRDYAKIRYSFKSTGSWTIPS